MNYFINNSRNITNIVYIYINKQPQKTKAMTKQANTYKVVYSDGVRILDYISASNLSEAKKIAAGKAKNYGTAYYKVARCWNGGVNGSNQVTNWH